MDTIGECVLAVMRERYAKLHKYRKKGWMKDERTKFLSAAADWKKFYAPNRDLTGCRSASWTG